MPIVIFPFSFSVSWQASDGTTDARMIVEFSQFTVENRSSSAILEVVTRYEGDARREVRLSE